MSITKESSDKLMLIDAKRIIVSSEIPEGGEENVCIILTDTPEGGSAVLGPVFMSEKGAENEGDLTIYVKGGYDNLPHIKDKIFAIIEKSEKENDSDAFFNIASGMVKKENASWSSLCRASQMSDRWSNILRASLGEVLAQSQTYRQVHYPAKINNISTIVQGLSYLNDDSLKDSKIKDHVISYINASHIRKSLGTNKSRHRMNIIEKNQMVEMESINRIMNEYGYEFPENDGSLISIEKNKIGTLSK